MNVSFRLRRSFLVVILIFSLLFSACGEINFTPDVTPLILGTEGTQPDLQPPEGFSEDIPPGLFEQLTSEQAIELCEESEYYGDETMGSCLAPGGDSYYVWISLEEVMEIDRANPFIQAFRFSALNRSDEIGEIQDFIRSWPNLPLFFLEIIGIGPLCGGAVVSILTGAGIVVTGPLAGGCVADAFAIANTADKISRDAEDFVNSLNDFYKYQIETAYNFCRMEGKSDAQCK